MDFYFIYVLRFKHKICPRFTPNRIMSIFVIDDSRDFLSARSIDWHISCLYIFFLFG